MKKRIVKGKEHILYDNIDEARVAIPNIIVQDDWREAKTADWIITDDGKVCEVLESGTLNGQRYVRTVVGMFRCASSIKIEGDMRANIYNFQGLNSNTVTKNRIKPTRQEHLFAKYVIKGDNVIDAFKKAYPKAKSPSYIKEKTNLLLRTERVKELIDKEIQKLLEETDISPKYLLLKAKEIVDNEEGRDSDKLSSLKILMEISGMLGKKEQKTESIQLFQGFSPEQLKVLEGGNVKKIGEQTRELPDMSEED